MRKVIGIGETILDIIFQNNRPLVAVPGGSVFNGMVSLGRTGLDVSFISETGNDRVGKTILEFMEENNLTTQYVNVFPEGKSPVSLAYLDRENDAEYLFYKDYPKQRLDVVFPPIHEDDIVVFGSYFALNPVLRDRVVELLERAKEKKAIIYYDPNFRSTHKDKAMKLAPVIIENLEYATVVRGSKEDFENMYKLNNVDRIYKEKIQFYCPNFLYTNGVEPVSLRTKTITKTYPVEQLETVSTIGAGDNFNAGLIYGLLKYNVRHSEIDSLSEAQWDKIVKCGTDFSAEVCRTFSNSISWEFAKSLSKNTAD
jgi:fructokinase